MRERNKAPVPEARCVNLQVPTPATLTCNTEECPAQGRWSGKWGPCTGSCGHGIQHYILQCHQKSSNEKSTVIPDKACPQPKPSAGRRPCQLPPCESESDNELPQNPHSVKEWVVGQWSQVYQYYSYIFFVY